MEFHQKYRGKMVIFRDITVNTLKGQGQKGNFTLLPPLKGGIRESTGEEKGERERERKERKRREREGKKREKKKEKEKEKEEEREEGEEGKEEEGDRAGEQVHAYLGLRRITQIRVRPLSSENCI
ncbi:unnamed protein product [Victoria cruziana]